MRRTTVMLILIGACLSTALCGAGLLVAWGNEGRDLVVPGATNVQIGGRGTARLHVTYDLPPNLRLSQVSQHFRQQGWRRITFQDIDRAGPAFTRLLWFGVMREVVVINLRTSARQTADISLARCLRIAGWVTCF